MFGIVSTIDDNNVWFCFEIKLALFKIKETHQIGLWPLLMFQLTKTILHFGFCKFRHISQKCTIQDKPKCSSKIVAVFCCNCSYIAILELKLVDTCAMTCVGKVIFAEKFLFFLIIFIERNFICESKTHLFLILISK